MEIDSGESAAGTAIIKTLASCSKSARDRALRILQKWLPRQSIVADEDMKKLWKGLFYCVWHSDKAQPQSELIERLSSLLLALDLPVSIHYFNVFLLTMRREWSGIDALRLEKFYRLIRRFVSRMFELMKRNGWDLELCKKLVCVLEQGTFLADDKFLGNGVNYHIASLFVEELKPFWPVEIEVADVLIQPFVNVLGKTNDKILVSKIKSSVFDELLKAAETYLNLMKRGKEDGDGESADVSFGIIGLKSDLAKKLFELGSSVNCFQGNRKVLFALSTAFGKLERDLKASGIEVKLPEVNKTVAAEEVPRLVAMSIDGEDPESDSVGDQAVTGDSNGVSDVKLSKKERKALKQLLKKNKKLKTAKVAKDYASVESDMDISSMDIGNSSAEPADDANIITLNKSALSNLQMQFEKVAAEAGLEDNGASVLEHLQTDNDPQVTKKKRKRSKSKDPSNETKDEEASAAAATTDGNKSAKKVRFSMKNNLVWKPTTPLPPQSLRIPPSVTPRGSALKKGVSPGPIKDTSSMTKRSSSGKKARKGLKSVSAKRPKKLKSPL